MAEPCSALSNGAHVNNSLKRKYFGKLGKAALLGLEGPILGWRGAVSGLMGPFHTCESWCKKVGLRFIYPSERQWVFPKQVGKTRLVFIFGRGAFGQRVFQATSPVLIAPVSAVPALCRNSAVCDRPSASRPNPSRQTRLQARLEAGLTPGGGFDGPERTGTRSDGRKQGLHRADGCGEDRASHQLRYQSSASAGDPVYMSRKVRKFRTDKFDTCNKRKFCLM